MNRLNSVKVIPKSVRKLDQKESDSGFELSQGGVAVSLNNEKFEYNSWELIEDKLVLNSTIKKGKATEPYKEIYIIRELFKDSMEIFHRMILKNGLHI
ncbi:MAG: lipocalin family protein [Ignavibacteria bacterium]